MEGNSIKSFENLCKIFEMRIKLDREKKVKTPSDILINYEKYAKKIDNIYNSSFINNFLISIMGAVFQCILFIFFKDPFFRKINLSIMLFNLLPIIPLDGSKILFEIYAYFLPFKKVIKYHYLTSFLFILIYLFLNYKYNFNNYLIISLFVYKTIEVIKNKSIILLDDKQINSYI